MGYLEVIIQASPRQGEDKSAGHRWQRQIRAANSAALQEAAHLPLDNQLEEDSSNLKTLEGYFDDFASAAVNEQDVLKQLVLNNTTLATSNESLMALVKKHSNEIKNLEREISA